jgi:hypothetical protein
MILLRHDCLAFKTATGESVPCSVHEMTVDFVGQSGQVLDEELVQHAAQAVLHYFKVEKEQYTISAAEFSAALETALRGLGFEVHTSGPAPAPAPPSPPPSAPARVLAADLLQLAGTAPQSAELWFFPLLREAVRSRLEGPPVVLLFEGLQASVKQLAGARRWTADCQKLRDQVVDYLRSCLAAAEHGRGCLLVVR